MWQKSDRPLSDNWFYGFLRRWPDVKLAKPQKLSMLRAQYASREELRSYFKELATILTFNELRENPERIYDMDETGISTEHAPPKIVCDSTSQPQAVTSPRSSTVTIIGGGNAIGNHIPPYFFFPGKRWNDQFLDGAPPGSSGEMSDSGWSNAKIFQNYLTKHFVKHAGISTDPMPPKTLVLFDGHRSHVSLTLVEWAKKHNVILFVLPPHTSHITQPLDVAVFGPFKSMYSRECQLYLQRNPGVKITKYEVAKLTAKPYLRAMSPDNLASAFRKSGIYLFSNKTIEDLSVAPATIYPHSDTGNQENEAPPDAPPLESTHETPGSRSDVIPPVQVPSASSTSQFLQERRITKVFCKPKKKFVPPFLTGNLLKQKNVEIMQSSRSTKKLQNQTIIPAKSTHLKRSATTSTKRAACVKHSKPTSPQPGLSSFWVNSSDSEQDSSPDVSDDDSENCCVCGKHTPPGLRSCPYLVIVKWAYICKASW
ncbi:uncharacterized protein LOC124117724 [Haliotis rufescens]|uniref:uncharacterized protein LOC124117724 n=1 Tax=Haliotis rufescens TaxID=6454 RepID=UPI00201E7ED5|nr:uncharacterized protein LOC124117724 [Haliotis rufescens]